MPSLTRTRQFRGQSLVEFALVAPIFFMLLFGVMEFGLLVWTSHKVENGTREGMRLAVVRGAESGDPATCGDVQDEFEARTSGLSGPLSVNCIGVGGPRGSTVTVSATYSYATIFGTLLGLDATISIDASSKGVIHN